MNNIEEQRKVVKWTSSKICHIKNTLAGLIIGALIGIFIQPFIWAMIDSALLYHNLL